MSSPSPSTPFSTSKPSSNSQQSRGSCVLSGIAVCENERYFNEKQFYKLFDAQLFVRDEVAGDGLLASLKYYDPTRAEPDSSIVRAFFVAVSVCGPRENSKRIPINSSEFILDEYDLIGDILSAYPINDWSEEVVNPNQAPYATASGIIKHIDETDNQITARINLENYLGILDGRGTLSVSIHLDLTTPRWKPNGTTRRAPYLKVGQYVTATGSLIGVSRGDDNKVTTLRIGADNVVNVGLASRVLNVSGTTNTPSQAYVGIPVAVGDSDILDPTTPTPAGKKFSMARLKRKREASEPHIPSTPQPISKRTRKSQLAASKINKGCDENSIQDLISTSAPQ
ncbi:hypothetical protein FA13DRAFT_1708345 [Coprinellus micaceus]|uniref:Uncharacterized protein n=1 Tax=Coprinellus micaceus TaxID=71717 RepID=A0A4Y7TJA6_COPMI|nr:hypothetical protein FA13DRAFT_1708345 [Coprinellus micaceus]